jgi:hypothetical protein
MLGLSVSPHRLTHLLLRVTYRHVMSTSQEAGNNGSALDNRCLPT